MDQVMGTHTVVGDRVGPESTGFFHSPFEKDVFPCGALLETFLLNGFLGNMSPHALPQQALTAG